MSIVLTREQAHALAWAAPLTTLATEVGISNVMLGRSLRVAGIPLPGVGYWAKLAAGKPVKRPALPAPDLSTPRYVWVSGSVSGAFLQRVSGRPGEREEPWEDIEELTARFRSRMPSLRMPRGWLHDGTKKLLVRDERTRQKAASIGGLLAQFYRPKFGEAVATRRLNFANRLGFAFLRIGGSMSFRDADAKSFSANVGSGHASFTIDDIEGKLRLTATEQRIVVGSNRWTDDDSGKLEARIPDILTGLARIAVLAERKWREDIRLRRELDDAAVAELAAARTIEAARAEAKAKKRRRKKRVKELVKAARGAQKSQLIRDYVERSRRPLGKNYPADQVEAWAAQALEIADALDPWKNGKATKSFENLSNSEMDEDTQGKRPSD